MIAKTRLSPNIYLQLEDEKMKYPSPALVTQWFGTDIATAIRHREFISKIFYGTTPEAMRAALDCCVLLCRVRA